MRQLPPAVTVAAALRFEVPPRLAAEPGVRTLVVGVAARELDLSGEGPILVTGSCGLLVEGGRRGSLVVPRLVRSQGGEEFHPDATWQALLVAAAMRAGKPPLQGTLVQADEVTDEAAARARLAAASGALTVDLESAAIARAAVAAGRPWAVLRWVGDSPERPLEVLRELLGGWPAAEPPAQALVAGLLRRPWLLPGLGGVALAALSGRRAAGLAVLSAIRSARSHPSAA